MACDVLGFFFFFSSLFLFWQLDFLDQTLSWKFIHLSANPGILFVKMAGMMSMGGLHVKTWAIACKFNLRRALHIHTKVKISFLPFLRIQNKKQLAIQFLRTRVGLFLMVVAVAESK